MCSYNKLLKTTKAVLCVFFIELFEVRYVAHLRYASTLNVEAAVFSETSLPVKRHIRYQKTIMSLLQYVKYLVVCAAVTLANGHRIDLSPYRIAKDTIQDWMSSTLKWNLIHFSRAEFAGITVCVDRFLFFSWLLSVSQDV